MQEHGYHLHRVLGTGTVGRVLLVSRGPEGSLFAAKEIRMAQLSEEEQQQALQEVAVLRSLDHPNILRCWDAFRGAKGLLYVVMEYACGGTLAGFLKHKQQSPLPEERVLDYFVQLALALKHVHNRKLLHRDIKTQNVYLAHQQRLVKLGDFGVASVLRNSLAFARAQCGTPYYFSPEVCRHRPYSSKSDVWSLGCLLYELCARHLPFRAANLRQLMANICAGQYQPLPQMYSSQLNRLVSDMLHPDPARRPSVAAILQLDFVRERIQVLCEDLSSRPLPPDPPQVARPLGASMSPVSSPEGRRRALSLPGAGSPVLEKEKAKEQPPSPLLQRSRSAAPPAEVLKPTGEGGDSPTRAAGEAPAPAAGLVLPPAVSNATNSKAVAPAGAPAPQRGWRKPSSKESVINLEHQIRMAPVVHDGPAPVRARSAGANRKPQQPAKVCIALPPKRTPLAKKPSTAAAPAAAPVGGQARPVVINLAPHVKGISKAAPARKPAPKPVTAAVPVPVPADSAELLSPPPASASNGIPEETDCARLVGEMASVLQQQPPAAQARPQGAIQSHPLARAPQEERRSSLGRISDGTASVSTSVGGSSNSALASSTDDFTTSADDAAPGPHKFWIGGAELSLPQAGANVPLNHRIEALRIYLETTLGLDAFVAVYNLLNGAAGGGEDAAETEKKAVQIVGNERRDFVSLVSQLIFSEAMSDAANYCDPVITSSSVSPSSSLSSSPVPTDAP